MVMEKYKDKGKKKAIKNYMDKLLRRKINLYMLTWKAIHIL